MSEVAEALVDATKLMEVSWQEDVLPLLVSQKVRREVGQHVAGYGTAGRLIVGHWYPQFVLATCRRIHGHGDDEVGIRRALLILRRFADDIDLEAIVEHQRSTGPVDDDYLPLIERNFHRLVEEGGGDPEMERLGRRVVQHDLDLINDTLGRAERIATSVVAHRLEQPKETDPVTQEELDRLLVDLAAIYRRWSLILRGADVDTSVDRVAPTTPLAHALQLHDPRRLAKAVVEASREGQPLQPLADLDLSRVRVEYHVLPPEATSTDPPDPA